MLVRVLRGRSSCCHDGGETETPPNNVIAEIRRQGMTVLMVEQNAALALRMADRAYVMESGRIALEGAARDLLDNADVRRAYLGG